MVVFQVIFCFFGSHSFPYQSLLLGTNVPNDILLIQKLALVFYFNCYMHQHMYVIVAPENLSITLSVGTAIYIRIFTSDTYIHS